MPEAATNRHAMAMVGVEVAKSRSDGTSHPVHNENADRGRCVEPAATALLIFLVSYIWTFAKLKLLQWVNERVKSTSKFYLGFGFTLAGLAVFILTSAAGFSTPIATLIATIPVNIGTTMLYESVRKGD